MKATKQYTTIPASLLMVSSPNQHKNTTKKEKNRDTSKDYLGEESQGPLPGKGSGTSKLGGGEGRMPQGAALQEARNSKFPFKWAL